MDEQKQLLRTWLKTKRLAMSPEEVQQASLKIQERMINFIRWQNIKLVHCYQEIDSLNEVSTKKICDFIASQPHIQLDLQSRNPTSQTTDTTYDLIIVPTLGFDKRCYRLGWGGGYYDQFLATQKKALKVGLCFNLNQFKHNLPNEPHDVRLDAVITETAVISGAEVL